MKGGKLLAAKEVYQVFMAHETIVVAFNRALPSALAPSCPSRVSIPAWSQWGRPQTHVPCHLIRVNLPGIRPGVMSNGEIKAWTIPSLSFLGTGGRYTELHVESPQPRKDLQRPMALAFCDCTSGLGLA